MQTQPEKRPLVMVSDFYNCLPSWLMKFLAIAKKVLHVMMVCSLMDFPTVIFYFSFFVCENRSP